MNLPPQWSRHKWRILETLSSMSPHRVCLACCMMERLNCEPPPFILHAHAFYHPNTHTHTMHMPLHHRQTFKQVPPGVDGWRQSALPPVSYTHNLIWGKSVRGGGHRVSADTKAGLIEASQAVLFFNPLCVRSYPLGLT